MEAPKLDSCGNGDGMGGRKTSRGEGRRQTRLLSCPTVLLYLLDWIGSSSTNPVRSLLPPRRRRLDGSGRLDWKPRLPASALSTGGEGARSRRRPETEAKAEAEAEAGKGMKRTVDGGGYWLDMMKHQAWMGWESGDGRKGVKDRDKRTDKQTKLEVAELKQMKRGRGRPMRLCYGYPTQPVCQFGYSQ